MQGKKRNRVMAVETENGKAADYEQVRNARIEENKRRMQELGLLNLVKEVSREASEVRRKRHRPQAEIKQLRVSTPLPARRSSRLQNATPVSYADLSNWHEKEETTHNLEIYTEEHEKLLGSYESEWVLFQDGYGADGNRVYDPVKGKTCHQCRQKTLGHRTRCSTCDLVQGQFCGDCLYTRYGENVLEANKNPEWVCPVCRGICNCSLCRVKKGWAPTGYLYRKARSQGFKSVAHYLILSQRSSTKSESTDASTKSESTDAISTACHIEDNKDVVPLNVARRSITFASLPIVASCEGQENDPSLTSESSKREENNSLPDLSCCKREENDSLPNLACGKRELEPGEDSIICDSKRTLADEKMASNAASEIEETKQDKNQRKSSKAASQNDSEDAEIISFEEPEQDKNQRKLSKAASQNDLGDVEIISIDELEQDKNQTKSARCNTYVRGGIAERLRTRSASKGSS